MSLSQLWGLCLNYPAQMVNGLALCLALAGSWLLLATRCRERRAARLLASAGGLSAQESTLDAGRVERLNRFFYGFAAASLLGAVLLSRLSADLAGRVSF